MKGGSHAGSKIGGRTNTAGNLNTPTITYLDKLTTYPVLNRESSKVSVASNISAFLVV